MKNQLIFKSIILITVLLSLMQVRSQADSKLGTLPVYDNKSENIFFINADAGEMISFAVLDEAAEFVAMNTEENIFYALSRHYIYKGNINTGEILNKFQFMEVLEQKPEDYIDPNMYIYTMGVSKDGKALFGFNKDYTKFNPVEVFMVDVNTETKSVFGVSDSDGESILSMNANGMVEYYNKKTGIITHKDSSTGEVHKEIATGEFYNKYPDYKKFVQNKPTVISEELLSYMFVNQGSMKASYVLYNTETAEIVLTKEWDIPGFDAYPLYYKNTKNYFYARKDCKFKQGNLNSMQECVKPENNKIIFFKDKALQNEHMTIPNASFAMIYNDVYALVGRNFEIVLYNLESKEQEWVIDTDF